ncbi:putative tubulin polyglutamylase [Aureococcus anophagefferens]|uniref:Tubulin polyglutamylase n=1 Tax=Aureococcus anophagefferens TaxID=44056 RepID=A0ABR1GFQ5_AURAN
MAPKRKGGTPKQEASKKKKAPAKSTAKKRPAPASAAQVKTEAPTSAPSTKKAKAPKKVKAEAPPPPPPPPPAPPTIAFGSGAARQPHRAGEPRAGNRPGVSRPFGLHRVDAADRAALAWEGELSGVLSAQCMAEDAEPCRLLGTSLVAFDVAAGGDAGRELRDLCRAVNPTAKATRTHYGVERFNADGEPGKDKDEATTTVKRLLDKVRQGKLLARAAAAVPFLEAAHGLMAPAHLPHKAPCLRCVCVAARGAGGLDVEVRVYATRLLFYLIADDAVKAVLNHIAPAGAVLRREAPPPTADLFVTSGAAAAAPFTLEGVMRSAEHCGGPEDAQPAEIALPMKPYQLMALRWMRSMEELDRGLNGLFWERRDFVDGGCFYYAPDLGEARLEAPPTVHGGLLSDEMGMGKTLEMLSLVCARPATAAALAAADLAADEREAPDDGAAKPLAASRATLLVLPPALVSQWLDEIRKSTVAPGPRVACFVTDEDRKALVPERCDLRGAGGKKATKREFFVQRRAALERLADHDVVVTTYNALTGPVYDKRRGANNGDAQPLSQIHWHRVVLDEMQMVSSPNTVLARTCADLWASSRWMVSGTPLCDGILDLNGELRFLGVYPFSLSDASDGFWHHCVQRPWDLRDPAALERLELLLRTVAMRHSKGQVYASGDLEGRPILELPSRSDGVVAVDVGESSEAVVLRALGAVAGAVGKRGAAAPALTDAKDVDELLRFYNRNVRGVHAGADGQSAACSSTRARPSLAGEAIARLAAADRNAGDRRRTARAPRAPARGSARRTAGRGSARRTCAVRRRPSVCARCDGIYGDREAYDDYLTSRIGREDAFAVGDAHARLGEVRGLGRELEQSRRDSKARARRAALLWTLARFALGHGDDFLVSDLAGADGRRRGPRLRALRRRRRACAAFVVERALPGAEVARALARRGAEDLPLLERWLRVEASARATAAPPDAAQEAAATAHAAVAADEAAHGAAGGDDRASLLAVAKAADAAAERAPPGHRPPGRRPPRRARRRGRAKAALVVAARSGDADDSLAVLEDRALAGARAGRLAERDYLAAEEMGEDATRAREAGPAGAIKVQLSARVAQQGLKDLARLEEERSPPETKCPVCYTTCDSSPAAAPPLSLCYTGCVPRGVLRRAQQLVLTGGVDQAVRRGVQRDDALRLADEGRLEGNCALCRKGFVLGTAHVTLSRGDSAAALSAAVREWRERDDCAASSSTLARPPGLTPRPPARASSSSSRSSASARRPRP